MMKYLITSLIMLAIVTCSSAQQSPAPARKAPPMHKGPMVSADTSRAMGMCGMMNSVMAERMMIRAMIPVQDGFIVAVGNQLLKYDANLNLKKEVSVRIDTLQMQQFWNQMMSGCRMRDTSGTAAPPSPGAR